MDPVQQLACPSEEVLRRLEIDTRYIRPGAFADPPAMTEIRPGFWGFRDAFGVGWAMKGARYGEGLYCEIVESPLADVPLEGLGDYPWPRGDDPAPFRGLRAHARALRETTDYALVSGITGVVFEYGWYLRGLERFYLDMVTQPEYVEAVLDRTLAYWIDFERTFLAEVGASLDVICVGDDIAMQSGPLFPPAIYRDIVKPRQKALYEEIRRRTRAKLWYHSCGAVVEYIPDLVEMGVDVLNPVQVSARGMDPRHLKAEFGDRIAFWGGGVDTQHVFPRGSAEAVRRNVRENLEAFRPGGGYVFNCVHNIQPDVPAENLAAFWEAAHAYR